MNIRRTYWHSDAIDKGYPVADKHEVRFPVERSDPRANLVSSQLVDGRHAPALDLDLHCELLESSTPGHHHLLIDHPLPWWRYRMLLLALVWAGLIERKYYRHSVRRGMTFLRLPGVTKGVARGVDGFEAGPPAPPRRWATEAEMEEVRRAHGSK